VSELLGDWEPVLPGPRMFDGLVFRGGNGTLDDELVDATLAAICEGDLAWALPGVVFCGLRD
jgi:hypothetical protein